MKKRLLICLVLAVVLCLSVALVACDGEKIEAGTLAEMLENVRVFEQERATSTTGNYQLAAKTVIGEVECNVQWSVEITTEGVTSGVSVGEIVDDYVTIQINDETPVDVQYNLVATLVNSKGQAYKDSNGNPYQVSFAHSIPAYVVNTYAQYKEACKNKSSDTIRVVGYIVDIISISSESSSKGSVYLQDADGNGYYAYAPTETTSFKSDEELYAAFPIGSRVEVSGSCTVYNGQYEFNKGCSIKIKGQAKTADQLITKDATNDWGKAANNSDTALIDYQNTLVKIEGAKFTRIDGKYYYFTVNGVEFNLYYNIYFLSEEDTKALFEKFVVGKQATVTGLVCVYSNKYQLYAVSTDAISNVVDATFTSAEKFAAEKKALSLTTEYTANASVDLPSAGTSFTDVAITWTFKGDAPSCATIADGKLNITVGSETQEFTLVATLAIGEDSTNEEFTIKVIVSNSFVSQALKAGEALNDKASTADSYYIIGTVSEINRAYDASYKNVSFYVSDGTQKILVYNYNLDDASTIAVGQAIAFKAPIKKYSGTIEAVSKFEKVAVVDLKTAAEKGIAGTGEEGTLVYGQISKINTAYSADYNNISVTITDGTNSLYVYRLAGGADLSVGTYILVTGTPSAYNGSAQIAAGATYVASAKYELTDAEKLEKITLAESVGADFTLDSSATWAVKSGEGIAIDGTKATVTRGAEDSTVVLTATIGTSTKDFTVVVKAASTTPAYTDADNKITMSVKTWAEVTGTANGVDVKSVDLGEATVANDTMKYYTSGNQLRTYKGSTTTITAKEGYTIVSVKITYANKNDGTLLNGTTEVASGTEVTVNASSISFTMSKVSGSTESGNEQVQITAIEIVYAPVEASTAA